MSSKPPLLTPVLRWVLVALVIANTAGEMVYTLIPIYLSRLGASPAQIGLVFTTSSIFLVGLQFFGGWISDRLGRLITIAIGSVIASLGYLGYFLAPSWPWIIPAMCMDFVSGALVGPSFSALVAEQSLPEHRGKTFGVMRGAVLTVTIVGPLLGGFLADRTGFKLFLGIGFVMYFSAALLRIWLAWRFRGQRYSSTDAQKVTFRGNLRGMIVLLVGGGILTWILITDGVRDIAFNLSSDLLPVFLTTIIGMTVAQVGIFRSIRGVATVLTTLGAGWLSDRLGEHRIIFTGFFVQALGLFLLILSGPANWVWNINMDTGTQFGQILFTISPQSLLLIASGLVIGAGIGLLFPAFDSLISKAVPPKMRGMAYGLFDSSRSILAMPMPAIGGVLWEHISPTAPFLLTALMNFFCAFPAWLKLRISPKSLPTSTIEEAPALIIDGKASSD
jgi:MFS family permease